MDKKIYPFSTKKKKKERKKSTFNRVNGQVVSVFMCTLEGSVERNDQNNNYITGWQVNYAKPYI